MNRKIIKTIVLLIIFALIICTINCAYADDSTSTIIKNTFNGVTNSTAGRSTITNILSGILGIVRTIGAAVAIIILMTVAAKYMIASAGDRADIKKYAINYVIGAMILFGASGILTLVKNFVDTSIE